MGRRPGPGVSPAGLPLPLLCTQSACHVCCEAGHRSQEAGHRSQCTATAAMHAHCSCQEFAASELPPHFLLKVTADEKKVPGPSSATGARSLISQWELLSGGCASNCAAASCPAASPASVPSEWDGGRSDLGDSVSQWDMESNASTRVTCILKKKARKVELAKSTADISSEKMVKWQVDRRIFSQLPSALHLVFSKQIFPQPFPALIAHSQVNINFFAIGFDARAGEFDPPSQLYDKAPISKRQAETSRTD